MERASEYLTRLRQLGGGEDELDVELLFPESIGRQLVEGRLREAVPGEAFELESGSQLDEDDDWLVSFPNIPSIGNEGFGFSFGRALGREVGAEMGNFLPVDSLYGEDAVARSTKSVLSNGCGTTRTDHRKNGWPHRETRTARAWRRSRGDGVRIASIDTGYTRHDELDGCLDIDRGVNVVEGGSDASDRFSGAFWRFPGHGTTTKSVIASRGGVNESDWTATGPGSVTGASPEATIVPIRAVKSVITILQPRLPRAIRAAVEQDCQVIAMCLGGPTPVVAVQRALAYAIERGLVIVSAAGNCYPAVVFPAAFSRYGLSMAVGAVGYGDRDEGHGLLPWRKSPAGRDITIVAPGEDVPAARMRQASADRAAVVPAQGTTLAASLTAGIAALWIAHHGHDRLRQIAQTNGTTVHAMFVKAAQRTAHMPKHWTHDHLRKTGNGLIDADRILDQDLEGLAIEAAHGGRHMVKSGHALAEDFAAPQAKLLAAVASRKLHGRATLDELAAELIWVNRMAGAYRRAAAHGVLKSMDVALPPIPISDELRALVEEDRALAEAVLDERPD